MSTKEFEVALSFAGAQRPYVAEVARHLQHYGVKVFYDEFERVRLWGRDLQEEFQQVYFDRSDYVVMFLSTEYVTGIWTGHEKRSALAQAIQSNREYVLPVRFDDSALPGLNPSVRYEDARQVSAGELARLILVKLGRTLTDAKFANPPAPASPELEGVAQFDHYSHNGVHVIGAGPLQFDTNWSQGGWVYAEGPTVTGVAISEATEIDAVRDASGENFTSRTRNIGSGDNVIVLRNKYGNYAALKIEHFRELEREADVRITYRILPDGRADFGAHPLPTTAE